MEQGLPHHQQRLSAQLQYLKTPWPRLDLEIAFALESLTNDRLRDQAGVLHRVRPEDRSGAQARCR